MSGTKGMGVYGDARSQATWLESLGGANKLCLGCVRECKQPANVTVVACRSYLKKQADKEEER